MEEIQKFLNEYFNNNKYIFCLEDLYTILEKNNITVQEKKEVLQKVYEHNKNLEEQEKRKSAKLLKIQAVSENKKEYIYSSEQFKETKIPESLNLDVSTYLSKIKNVENLDKIDDILPHRDDVQFDNVLSMIIVGLYKEKVEMVNYIRSLSENEPDIRQIFEDDLDEIDSKIEYILDYKNYEPQTDDFIEENNKIIFLKNSSYEPIIFQNLKGYEEYYESFLGLVNQIRTGKYKKMRNFSNNNKISDVLEVKDFKTRILFTRIKENTYVILAAFVKKCDTNLLHRNFVENISQKYQLQKSELLRFLEQESFLIQEEKYYQDLISLLADKKKVKIHEFN